MKIFEIKYQAGQKINKLSFYAATKEKAIEMFLSTSFSLDNIRFNYSKSAIITIN